MKNPSNDFLKEKIQRLPYVDRISLLTCSILANHKEPTAAVLGLIELISRLSQYLNEDKRFRISERLRSAADSCEKNVLVEGKSYYDSKAN